MLLRLTESMELLIVFPLMILGIWLTHVAQRWADRRADEE